MAKTFFSNSLPDDQQGRGRSRSTGVSPVEGSHGLGLFRSTGVPPVESSHHPQCSHGRDAHATEDASEIRSTGVSPVESSHGPDAHATEDGRYADDTIRIRQGANLPHWRQDGAIYAVTFRLADSVPAQVLDCWQQEREQLVQATIKKDGKLSRAEADRLRVLFTDKVEVFLNNRHGSCWMMRDDVAELVQKALLHFDGTRYALLAWCVMPNHVHVVVWPRPEHTLESILHSWKSFTSRQISKLVGKTGTIWQAEYYDHLIRDQEDLSHAVDYVLNNPQAAGLKNWRWVGRRCVSHVEG